MKISHEGTKTRRKDMETIYRIVSPVSSPLSRSRFLAFITLKSPEAQPFVALCLRVNPMEGGAV